jgi:hypothetical protein
MCIALIIHDVSTGYNVAMQFYGDMSYGEMYIIIIGLWIGQPSLNGV